VTSAADVKKMKTDFCLSTAKLVTNELGVTDPNPNPNPSPSPNPSPEPNPNPNPNIGVDVRHTGENIGVNIGVNRGPTGVKKDDEVSDKVMIRVKV
jgi:hypothetical protein